MKSPHPATRPRAELDPAPSSLPVMRVRFRDRISDAELPRLRGAFVAKVGREQMLWHNHLQDGKGFRYRYPLIQYKRLGGQAALVCLGPGVEQAQQFFAHKDRHLRIGSRRLEMQVEDMRLETVPLRIWKTEFYYRITDWIGVYGSAYQDWHTTESLVDRVQYLERRITNQLISYATAMGWRVTDPIQVRIHRLGAQRTRTLKGLSYRCMDLEFGANLVLPEHIGLGKGTSLGLGVVRRRPSRKGERA